MSRFTRSLPIVGAAVALGVGGAGANALADGNHHGHHSRGERHDRGLHKGDKHYSAWDKQYLQSSIEGDLFEIAGGKMAQQQGSTDGVKSYGARLVADHTKSLNDAIALAKKLGIEVPKAPTPQEQGILELVGSFSGSQFDKAYVDAETMDHQQDISEAKDEVDEGSNYAIRNEAKTEIPTLQQHLQMGEDLGGKQATDPLS